MRITDLLSETSIELNVSVKSKSEAIDILVGLHEKNGNITDMEVYKKGILDREAQGSTAVGEGIAIPHTKNKAVKKPALAAITVPDGVDYEALDGKPSNLIFMIAAPENGGDVHLELLSRLMVMLMDEEFRKKLLSAKSKAEFLEEVDKAESEKYMDEPETQPQQEEANIKEGYRVLAVTACPTGIAHTYMAAEALEKAGRKMGYPLKAETNGSGGAKNVLTSEEIKNADGIIIAADKSVEMSRFDGKPLISVKVSDGIKKPEELIKRIKDGDAPIYHHKGNTEHFSSESESKEGLGRRIYKHLMNGVSHMLPFVVAGGIFIAIAFLIDTIAGAPQDANFGTATPAAAWFKTIGGYAFDFMIPILAGYIAMSIADRPGLLVGFVGGFLAVKGSTFFAPSGDIPSGFLGGLLAGFAGGYMMLVIEKLCDRLPRSLEGIKPVLLYPLIGLGGIGVLMCAVNPIMGVINTGMANALTQMEKSGFIIPLCALLAAMMAIDMGGPFNKAAYVFGTGMLTNAAALSAAEAQSSYLIMAAVMIGGMVPPLAIALSNTFFKNRWTSDERKNSTVNYIMGLSFITEGAIPYAASYPLKVIPSCMVGSAVAGTLSALFNCTLMAPHGGIFVFAVVGNWYWYLLSLAVGSIVSMLMLALLKKPIKKQGE